MDAKGVERRLAAILSANIVGYSRLMAEVVVATIHTLRGIAGLVGDLWGRVVDAPLPNARAETAPKQSGAA